VQDIKKQGVSFGLALAIGSVGDFLFMIIYFYISQDHFL
jgi:hypothetical protein